MAEGFALKEDCLGPNVYCLAKMSTAIQLVRGVLVSLLGALTKKILKIYTTDVMHVPIALNSDWLLSARSLRDTNHHA